MVVSACIVVTRNDGMSVLHDVKTPVVCADVNADENHVLPVIWCGERAGYFVIRVADIRDDVRKGNDVAGSCFDVGFPNGGCEYYSLVLLSCDREAIKMGRVE